MFWQLDRRCKIILRAVARFLYNERPVIFNDENFAKKGGRRGPQQWWLARGGARCR